MNNNILKLLQYFLVVSILIFLLFEISMAGDFDNTEIGQTDYPSWFKKNPFNELNDELNDARKSGKLGLMVLFTTKNCSDCNVFIQKSLGNSDIASIIKNNFNSVGMKIFNDENMTSPRGVDMPIKKFVKLEKVELSPTLVFYGKKGKRLLRVSGYQSPDRFKKILGYLTSKHYRIETLHNHLKHREVKDILVKPIVRMKHEPMFSK